MFRLFRLASAAAAAAMMIKGTVVVYSIPACPHCRTAKATLTQRGLQYVDVDLERFPHLRPWLRETTGKTSVPQIFFNSRHIGGNSELQDLVDDASQWEQLVTLLEQTELNPSDAGAPRIPKPEEAVTTSAPAAVLPVECEKDELSRLAIDLHDRSNLIMDHRVGLFTKIRDSFSGEAFVNWMIKEKESDEANALDMGQQLMDKHFIQNVSGGADSTKFEGSAKAFYRMTEDDNQGALNSGETAGCPPLPAGELAENLRKLMLTMYAENISPDGKSVNYAGIKASDNWRNYVRMARELQRVDIFGLNREEKLAFFINVYNALVVHGNIATGHPTNVWQRWKFFNNTAYVLGGSPFTLQDIENGVLRANKKGVGALSPQFSKADPRRRLSLERAEPRIHFALNCGAKSCPPIKTFSAQNIQSELDLASASYLETDDGIRLEPAKGVVHLSTLLKWYRSDFGEDDKEVLTWVLKHLTGKKAEQLKQMLDSGNFKINYIPYDWTNNAK
ncbi:uncharacterized protein LOC122384072 isoform X1 [Amphibalanus amphitrite]|uniref:uncharacterized protein LOC122384072 isoform X1 n=1 Tax=Amphibalanus amphitrite TaxID=1232801 RepID=UPI001C8FC9C9|nr:uncharacterized protein LOC122384072 isoform X1 [Amphibalanus amphitrite]